MPAHCILRSALARAGSCLSLVLIAWLSTGAAMAQSLASQGFTYQGQLRNSGGLVSNLCDMQFSLWDAATLGNLIGGADEELAVPVSQGRFAVQLNELGQFGANPLNGQARWLRVDVRCVGDFSYVELAPRQPLAPSPYAFALPGVVPGVFGPTAGNSAGSYSLAAGRRSKAPNTGAFVWSDSTNADFSSTVDNQVAFRAANGMFIASDAGGAKAVPVGTRYRDNAIVAWARVTAGGTVDTNFNVASVTHPGAGRYTITLQTALQSGFSLMAVVTPEIDPDGLGNPPTGAANVRIPATNNVAAGNTFDVYMYNGNFNLVDNDFQVIVTGR